MATASIEYSRSQRMFSRFHIFFLLPVENLTGLPVEDNNEIGMSFPHCNFVHCQKARIFIYSLGELDLKILFMNGFHRFPIQSQVLSNLFYSEVWTQGDNIVGQSFSYSFSGSTK